MPAYFSCLLVGSCPVTPGVPTLLTEDIYSRLHQLSFSALRWRLQNSKLPQGEPVQELKPSQGAWMLEFSVGLLLVPSGFRRQITLIHH
jgi:hypothetical protein